ncbi:MAG: hypothetical protein ACOYKE_08665 [Ferruginibacter sp.]
MKDSFSQICLLKIRSYKLALLFVCSVLFYNAPLMAQTDSVAVVEEPTLISPSIDLLVIQKGDSSVDLKAKMQAKIEGAFKKLPFLKVSFFLTIDTSTIPLGFVITNDFGKAELNIKSNLLKLDQEGKLNIKAVFAGNKAMESCESEMSVKRARLILLPIKEDSSNSVQITLVDFSTGKEIPVPETALGLFVKRSFFPLKIGEGTTDENGTATILVPSKLPGDEKGIITLIAKLDESELYGGLEADASQPWGVPVSNIIKEAPRALWSSHPPIWMVVTFIVLVTVVWGHYIVIIYELIRLRKEEPHDSAINIL